MCKYDINIAELRQMSSLKVSVVTLVFKYNKVCVLEEVGRAVSKIKDVCHAPGSVFLSLFLHDQRYLLSIYIYVYILSN